MNPLASLVQEHRIITRLADSLEVYAQRLLADPNAAPREDLTRFVAVLEGLVDHIHHEKEESVLLPFVVRHGFDWDSGSVPEVRREHRQERYLMDVLAQACEQSTEWSADDRRHAAETALAVVEFERAHLAMENRELFPELLARLGESESRELARQLEIFEPGTSRRNVRQWVGYAEELIADYPGLGRLRALRTAPASMTT